MVPILSGFHMSRARLWPGFDRIRRAAFQKSWPATIYMKTQRNFDCDVGFFPSPLSDRLRLLTHPQLRP